MKKLKLISALLMLTLLGTGMQRAFAQSDNQTMSNMLTTDSVGINALIMYPDSVRVPIFEASKYPEALVKLQTAQQNTQKAFTDLLSPYSKEQQEAIWNLTRYPGLINKIATGGKKSKSELEAIANQYTPEVREDVKKYGKTYYDLLVSINNLTIQNDNNFNALIAPYPPETQNALRQLVGLPQVLSLLTDNMNMTVMIGDFYRRNPQWLIQKTDSLNAVASVEHAQDVADWQASIDSDPDAQKQLQEAADEYADSNGYSSNDYNNSYSDDYVDNSAVYPYPYWFGYPSWYPSYYWYPYPYWYDWGFYYGPGHHMHVFGFPSYHFTYWYFYHQGHFNRYPNLGSHFISHYYGHRNSVSGGSIPVAHWVDRNHQYFSNDFATNRQTRVTQLQQYGKLQSERSQYNAAHPNERISTAKFIEQNKSNYPTLVSKEPPPSKGKLADPFQNRPEKQPRVKTFTETKKDLKREQSTFRQPVETQTQQPQQNRPQLQQPQQSRPQVQQPQQTNRQQPTYQQPQQRQPVSMPNRSAEEYHTQRWQESNPQPVRQAPAPQPTYTPQPQPRPQAAPVQQAPRSAPAPSMPAPSRAPSGVRPR